MSEEEARDVLENKPFDYVTVVKTEETDRNMENDRLVDENKEIQNDADCTALEAGKLKAEQSHQHFRNELQLDSAVGGYPHVEMHHGQNTETSKDQEDKAHDIHRKTYGTEQSSKQDMVFPREVGAEGQNQPTQDIDGEQSNIRSQTTGHKNVTDTYDVISRNEVQGFNEWESIHKDCLSEIPPIDPGALQDIERKANDVASNLDHLLGTLATSLKSLSVIGVQSVDIYRTTVENVEDTVDDSVKSMYALIAKCEELNSYMGPLYSMSAQIKDIKRTLDVFESVCK